MDDRNKLIEKLGELSAKAYMFGRMYHIDEVTELTKDINELIAKVFDYSPWHTGTPTDEGWYLIAFLGANKRIEYASAVWCYNEWDAHCRVIAWQKIIPYEEKENERHK